MQTKKHYRSGLQYNETTAASKKVKRAHAWSSKQRHGQEHHKTIKSAVHPARHRQAQRSPR